MNFYASWIYSVAKLDDRLQFALDISNADYRAGEARFKVANEDRAFLNLQIRGVLVKVKKFQWTMALTAYDVLDVSGGPYGININAGLSSSFNFDLY